MCSTIHSVNEEHHWTIYPYMFACGLTHWGWHKMTSTSQTTFKCICVNENLWILMKISLNFIQKGWINNIPQLVPIMASRWPGDNPWSEPMMVSLLTHICVTRPQWVNWSVLDNSRYMHNTGDENSLHEKWNRSLNISTQDINFHREANDFIDNKGLLLTTISGYYYLCVCLCAVCVCVCGVGEREGQIEREGGARSDINEPFLRIVHERWV